MEGLIQFCKCLSEPLAVRIVVLLLHDELKINQLQRILEAKRSTINLHLIKLRECNVVVTEMDGRWLRFRLNPDLKEFIHRVVETYRDDLSWDPKVTEDLARLERERYVSSIQLAPLRVIQGEASGEEALAASGDEGRSD
ncbi:MAG: ArsR family transcriptional regulator [Fimbriimonadaceae bacterium]|nr:ArsR family transcriptional regulator [Fimbriimonadaceae bacterium]